MTELRFDGRVTVITGAGRGLGRTYALLLASRGARIVVNDPGVDLRGEGADAAPARQVVDAIRAAGGEAIECRESVVTAEGGRAIIEAALDQFGRIDALIHNAGNIRHASLKEMSAEDFDAVVDVHLRGAFNVVRPAFPLMCKARYGRIVLTSSIGGLYGNYGVANYAVCKAGMIGLNNVIALEGESEGVKSNIIVPGSITRIAQGMDQRGMPGPSDQLPPMTPEMVAPVVAWLVHESCSITGEMLISIAGRVACAFIGESRGIYLPAWTPDAVGENIDVIRDTRNCLILPPVPHGHSDHVRLSIDMATDKRRADPLSRAADDRSTAQDVAASSQS